MPVFIKYNMKSYTILIDSIAGVKGKVMTKGESYLEHDFYADHLQSLIDNGSIAETNEGEEEVKEEPIVNYNELDHE